MDPKTFKLDAEDSQNLLVLLEQVPAARWGIQMYLKGTGEKFPPNATIKFKGELEVVVELPEEQNGLTTEVAQAVTQ